MKEMYKTPVQFRKLDKAIIALFPLEITTRGKILCYYNGKYGRRDYNKIITKSNPASEREFSELYTALEHQGYELKVIKKRSKR